VSIQLIAGGKKVKNIFQMTKEDIIDAIKNAEDYEVVGNILSSFHRSFTNSILNNPRIDVDTLVKVLFSNGMDYDYIYMLTNRSSEVLQYIFKHYRSIDVLTLPHDLVVQSGTASFSNNVFTVRDGTAYVKFTINYDISECNVFLIYVDYEITGTGAWGFNLVSNKDGNPYAEIDFDVALSSPYDTTKISYEPIPPKGGVLVTFPSESDVFSELLIGGQIASGSISFKLNKWLVYPVGKVLATITNYSYGMIFEPEQL